MKISKKIASAIVAGLCASGVVATGQPAPEQPRTATTPSATARGFTQPSQRVAHAFDSSGVVLEVLVKEGDKVTRGQPLVRLDDRMDRQELEVRRIDAESRVEIESAQKEYELRKVQYERKSTAPEGFSATEIEEARITMELAALKVAEAEQKRKQAMAVFQRQQYKVELMSMLSRIDGVIERISVDPGEMADPQKPEGVISVVNNNPLWVEMPLLPTWQAAKLEAMAKRAPVELEVRYVLDGPDAPWKKAKLIFIAPTANVGAGMQPVRLELANDEGRSSGLDMEVRLPPELAVDPNNPTASAIPN
jgi:multidrug efflux pump subunit AcrA (membrane-fusion protein)